MIVLAAVCLQAQQSAAAGLDTSQRNDAAWPAYPDMPFTIAIDPRQPPMTGRGGIIVHDLTGDGRMDYILSTRDNDFGPGRAAISAYDWGGHLLWIADDVDIQMNGNAERHGLPGWQGPGVAAGDIDGDGAADVLNLDTANRVVVRDGKTGDVKRTLGPFALPEGARQWSHLQIVDLRGAGDRDLILQADPYPFRWLKAIRADTGADLWAVDGYEGPKHGGFRAADIDGDGRDEVAGATIIDHDGRRMNTWDYDRPAAHFDALAVADVRPDDPGLEVVLLEEQTWEDDPSIFRERRRDDRTSLVSQRRIHWSAGYKGWEPQNAAVGKFEEGREGLQIWNRSRFNKNQQPWVLDQDGDVIARWSMADVAPEGWSERGIEMISSIDWFGGTTQHLAAKERHESGAIAVIDPMTGRFVAWWPEQADTVYVADVAGDGREEIIVVNGAAGEIRVYQNEAFNPHPPKPSPWTQNAYRRQKQNYNYYSP